MFGHGNDEMVADTFDRTVMRTGRLNASRHGNLYEFVRRTETLDGETRERIGRIINEYERKVATLLSDMGLDFVAANVEIPDPPKPNIGEVDLVFESGNTLLLVEVGAGKNSVSDKQWVFFFKWANDQAIAALMEKIGKPSHIITKTYFDLRSPPENMGGPEAVGVAKPGSGNMICYQEDFDRMAERIRRGDAIKDDFVQALSNDSDSSGDARRKLGTRM